MHKRKRSFPRNPDGSFIETPFSEDPVRWARDKQQNFYRKLSGAIRGLKSSSPVAAELDTGVFEFSMACFMQQGGAWQGGDFRLGLGDESSSQARHHHCGLECVFQALTAIVIVSALLLFVSSASAMARDVAGFLEVANLMIAVSGFIWCGRRGSLLHVHALPAAASHVHKDL